MLLGKWYQFALSLLGAAATVGTQVDWTPLGTKGAGIAATAIFVVKGILNIFQPAAGQTAVSPPGTSAASLVSHT